MVVGGKPYGGRGKTLWWSGEKSYRGRGKFYAQMAVTNTVRNVFLLGLCGLVMRITKIYARGSSLISADVRGRRTRKTYKYSRRIAEVGSGSLQKSIATYFFLKKDTKQIAYTRFFCLPIAGKTVRYSKKMRKK